MPASSSAPPTPGDAAALYVRRLHDTAVPGDATEHCYRFALMDYLTVLSPGVDVLNEPKRRVDVGAPDLQVRRGAGYVGNVETKDLSAAGLQGVEEDSERANPRTRDGAQVQRYRRGIENLVLTDYLEFRRYVDGHRVDPHGVEGVRRC